MTAFFRDPHLPQNMNQGPLGSIVPAYATLLSQEGYTQQSAHIQLRFLAPLMMEEPSAASLEKCEELVDRKDVAILATALDAEADFLITLDKKHFLKASIPPALGIEVLSPGEFLRSLERTFVEQ